MRHGALGDRDLQLRPTTHVIQRPQSKRRRQSRTNAPHTEKTMPTTEPLCLTQERVFQGCRTLPAAPLEETPSNPANTFGNLPIVLHFRNALCTRGSFDTGSLSAPPTAHPSRSVGFSTRTGKLTFGRNTALSALHVLFTPHPENRMTFSASRADAENTRPSSDRRRERVHVRAKEAGQHLDDQMRTTQEQNRQKWPAKRTSGTSPANTTKGTRYQNHEVLGKM